MQSVECLTAIENMMGPFERASFIRGSTLLKRIPF